MSAPSAIPVDVHEVIRITTVVLDAIHDPDLRAAFIGDPGGFMAYQGYMDDISDEGMRNAVARRIIDAVMALVT